MVQVFDFSGEELEQIARESFMPMISRAYTGGSLRTLRTDRMAARTSCDDLMVFCVHVAGRSHVRQHDRCADLAIGAGVLYEARSRWELASSAGSRSLTLQFSRGMLPLRTSELTAGCARTLDPWTPGMRIVSSYLRELSSVAESLTAEQRLDAERAAEPDGPLPALLYLRPSGFVLGSLDSADNAARRIADHINAAVIAVDYRVAPEHPFPAALDDCHAALEWAASTAATDYGIDRDRVAVLGESAGGGLAIAMAMIARDRQGPTLTSQFLDAPTIDDRCDTPSMHEFEDTPLWRGADTPIIWQHYLGTIRRGSDEVPILAAPGRAEVRDLIGLPRTWIATYQLDPTRDEVLDLSRRLIDAHVSTELHHYAGAFHLTHMIPGTAIGNRMIADKYEAIGRMLSL